MTPLAQLEEMSNEGDFGSFTAQDYFRLFLGKKTIQTFDDKGYNQKLAQIFQFSGEISKLMLSTLHLMNNRGAGIYMTVNETDGKGRRVANITRVRAVFADLDGAPLEPCMDFHPSLVVESSKGKYHCYWFTEDTPIAGFSALQKNLARCVGGDPKVHDLPRVMRAPGFFHNKSKPFLSRVCAGTGGMFKYRELVEWFPPEKVPQWSGKKYKLERNMGNMRGFYGVYGAENGERNSHVMRRIGGMIKAKKSWDYITAEAFREGYACNPPLDDHEINAILKSAQRYL